MGVGGGGLHGLEGALVVETRHILHDHVGKDGAGVVANHAPGFSAVEGPVWEHVLGALVVVGEHRVRDVGLQGPVDEVHQGFEGPEGVPE